MFSEPLETNSMSPLFAHPDNGKFGDNDSP